MQSTAPTLESQWLTPAKVAWILDIGERTLRDWTERRLIASVKIGGQVVRYDPAEVTAFILRHHRVARAIGTASEVQTASVSDEVWPKLQRLIDNTVDARIAQSRAA